MALPSGGYTGIYPSGGATQSYDERFAAAPPGGSYPGGLAPNIGPGGVGPGPGDFGGFGGFDSFQPMGGLTIGGGGFGEGRADIPFGSGEDPRRRPMRLGMPRQPFSGGGGTMVQSGGRTAMPMRGGGFDAGSFLRNFRGGLRPPRPGGTTALPGWPSIPGMPSAPGQPGTPSIPGQPGTPSIPGQPTPGANDWVMQGGPWATIQELLKYGFLGPNAGQPEGFGGVFGVNPPSEIMGGVRQRAVQDAGAQERAARLGLQSRGDMDPSTYGFQALQSQLQGQQGTQKALGEADLGLRQQQQQNYWEMMNNLLRAYAGIEGAKYGQPKGGSIWDSLIGAGGRAAATWLGG